VITASQTRQVTFTTTRSTAAYDRGAVDGLLAEAARTLDALQQGRTVGQGGAPLLLPRDVRTVALPPSDGAEGYLAADVEAFRTQLVATLEEYVRRFTAAASGPPAPQPAGRRAAAGVAHGGPPRTGPLAPAPDGAARGAAGERGGQRPGGTGPARVADPATGGGSGAPARPARTPVDVTHAPDGLGAYDVLVQVQRARSTLFGAARDSLVVRRPDGTELRVTGVEVVPGAAVVHVR
jgi:hypothetical protein